MLPLVLFLAANVLLLRCHSSIFADWLPKADSLDQKTLLYSALTAILLALAYGLFWSQVLQALHNRTEFSRQLNYFAVQMTTFRTVQNQRVTSET